MRGLTASAPGKIVLCGEYAVLDGAPAICMAVDRRARVRAEEAGTDWHSVTAPGFCAEEGRFVIGAGGVEWLANGAAYAVIDHVWQALGAVPGTGWSLTLDTREFADPATRRKLGVGSSAALTTALAAACCELLGRGSELPTIAREAHRRLQGGGSGVDVACSLAGGLIDYRMDRPESVQLSWPAGLGFAVLWSGVAADTQAKLERLRASGAHASRRELASAATEVATAWRDGSADAVLTTLGAYVALLRRFSIDHGLGIFDAGHRQLADAAEAAGLLYKPCGAGGGDIGIVLATDDAAIRDFVAAARATSFRRLDVAVEPRGVQLHREAH